MRNLSKIVMFVFCVLLSAYAIADGNGRHGATGNHYSTYKGNYKRVHRTSMLLLLNGIRNSYECEIPATDLGTVTATCHDHEVIDLKTNKIIGWATDATADVLEQDGGLVGTGTTFFHLRYGDFVVRGTGTIQPVLYGNPVHDGSPVTHIAGIFPENGEDNVLSELGTGLYEDATGTFSLLGALDMTNAAEGQARYHCIYHIDLELVH